MLEMALLIVIGLFFVYITLCALCARPNRMRDWVSRK